MVEFFGGVERFCRPLPLPRVRCSFVYAVYTHCGELSGAPATHIIYLPRWCHDPPDARVVAYFITLSSWSPPYARPRWCCGISHRNVSSLCLHSAALIAAKTTAGATVGILDVDAILPGGLRYTFDDGGCDHRPDPLALRPCRADLSWRSSSPAGEQSSSSWSTLATRMPGLVAIRVAVAAAVMKRPRQLPLRRSIACFLLGASVCSL